MEGVGAHSDIDSGHDEQTGSDESAANVEEWCMPSRQFLYSGTAKRHERYMVAMLFIFRACCSFES